MVLQVEIEGSHLVVRRQVNDTRVNYISQHHSRSTLHSRVQAVNYWESIIIRTKVCYYRSKEELLEKHVIVNIAVLICCCCCCDGELQLILQ